MSLPKRLIECVANVSEGRSLDVLDQLSAAIDAVPGCQLLHRDANVSAHRTVFTFAGTPEGVTEAAFQLYATAQRLIDMQQHSGEHPRIGAVDVCPLVNIKDVSQAELVALSQVLGMRVGEELQIPVFLYEQSATAEHRRNLATIRKGEYEGLEQKTKSPDWKPDFGPDYDAKFGATVLGARPFLIAWNINMEPGTPLSVAKDLAAKLRGSGRRGTPGLFPGLKAIGWEIEEFNRCQISCNVVDPDKTDLARVYLTAVNLAEEAGYRITGSELIGLIPEKYLRKAGKPFCFDGTPEGELSAAVSVLGLDDLGDFDYEDRVLERLMAKHLADSSL
ncbi:glutamate formimidoyltransferase [Lewinella sp. 4G2]|uniref:glutamate formimidoyltransferase n=1 Tax=Lewinella sp. 4G2 TaxID=1803372 RepID=UPI0007E1394F|nr:glutamate formimidoyltransferase [Lewinella sp. 4G2]OAV44439.1 glutamate formiminotransferase [Lewinella sp. 4G2]